MPSPYPRSPQSLFAPLSPFAPCEYISFPSGCFERGSTSDPGALHQRMPLHDASPFQPFPRCILDTYPLSLFSFFPLYSRLHFLFSSLLSGPNVEGLLPSGFLCAFQVFRPTASSAPQTLCERIFSSFFLLLARQFVGGRGLRPHIRPELTL